MKHIVCYSGGHSSALVAIEVTRKFGKENVILVNHDINANVEEADIKRFKNEVAEYLGLQITFVNVGGLPAHALPDQFDVTMAAQAFRVGDGSELCTNRLKTAPFMAWLKKEFPDGKGCIIYYGFDKNERRRVQRRSGIMGAMGYATDYPLALWDDLTLTSTRDVGIEPPLQYQHFKHANCTGCLKAGRQHWYVVYCTRPDIWAKAKAAEEEIGYSIINGVYLEELEPIFDQMKTKLIPATEQMPQQRFWANVWKAGINTEIDKDTDLKPCECVF